MAREFVMARLAACRGGISQAEGALDEALAMFLAPDEDKRGKKRQGLLEAVDVALGEATRAVQAAQEMLDEIDPAEGEPDLPEGDGDDPEDDDDENEDEDEDED